MSVVRSFKLNTYHEYEGSELSPDACQSSRYERQCSFESLYFDAGENNLVATYMTTESTFNEFTGM